MRLLIVDDDAPSRFLLESVFSTRGHTVRTAGDGIEALRMAREEPPDMVISDVLMPNMDGYRLCAEWHRDPKLANIVFAFYTGTYVEDGDEVLGISLGADAFLRKPMDSASLVHTLEKVHREKKTRKRHRRGSPVHDHGVLKEYSDRLIARLERKVAQLQESNAQLCATVELLTSEVDVKDSLIRRLSRELEERAQERDYSR